jgi:hypothetical protein
VTIVASPDPLEVFRAVLIARAVDTSLEEIPVRSNERDQDDVPPLLIASEAGALRHASVGAFMPARVGLSGYATTESGAAALYRTASDGLHRVGPLRISIPDFGTVGVWRIYDETGMQRPVLDPDTGWWRAFGVFDIYMADRAIG